MITRAEVMKSIAVCKALRIKPSANLVKLSYALLLLKAWQGKGKLAQTKMRKYTRKVKYYEKRVSK